MENVCNPSKKLTTSFCTYPNSLSIPYDSLKDPSQNALDGKMVKASLAKSHVGKIKTYLSQCGQSIIMTLDTPFSYNTISIYAKPQNSEVIHDLEPVATERIDSQVESLFVSSDERYLLIAGSINARERALFLFALTLHGKRSVQVIDSDTLVAPTYLQSRGSKFHKEMNHERRLCKRSTFPHVINESKLVFIIGLHMFIYSFGENLQCLKSICLVSHKTKLQLKSPVTDVCRFHGEYNSSNRNNHNSSNNSNTMKNNEDRECENRHQKQSKDHQSCNTSNSSSDERRYETRSSNKSTSIRGTSDICRKSKKRRNNSTNYNSNGESIVFVTGCGLVFMWNIDNDDFMLLFKGLRDVLHFDDSDSDEGDYDSEDEEENIFLRVVKCYKQQTYFVALKDDSFCILSLNNEFKMVLLKTLYLQGMFPSKTLEEHQPNVSEFLVNSRTGQCVVSTNKMVVQRNPDNWLDAVYGQTVFAFNLSDALHDRLAGSCGSHVLWYNEMNSWDIQTCMMVNWRYGEILNLDEMGNLFGCLLPLKQFSLKALCKKVIVSMYDTDGIIHLDVPSVLKEYLLQ